MTLTAGLAPNLEVACRRWAGRPALTHRGRTLSYGELWRQVEALAAAYADVGVQPGDRLICQLPDRPEHVVALAAAWARGAIHVGADHDLTDAELARLVLDTGARALVLHPSHEDDANGAAARAQPGRSVHIVLPGDGDAPARHLCLAEVLDAPSPSRPPLAPPHGPGVTALLFLTSGTTGRPKGVQETLPALWAKLAYFAEAFAPGPADVHLMYLPMSHAFGLKLSLTALLSGGRLVLLDRFSPEEALRLVTEERVSVLPGTPTHFTLLVQALDRARHRVDSLRWAVAAAAALTPPLLEHVYGKLGVEVFFVYGCSEGFLTSTTDRGDIFAGSVGHHVFCGPEGTPPDGRVAVVDAATGTALAADETGEIVFGARQPVRYWGEPEVATDGWYHTGDLGRMDAEGRLFVTGRLKELINRGGLKVAPSEVEATLVRHPAVADGAVVGVPDPVLGEAVCACVVVPEGEVPGLAELRSFMGTSLARHKLPDELCVVEAIPRTQISKVDRPALAELVAEVGPTERLRPR